MACTTACRLFERFDHDLDPSPIEGSDTTVWAVLKSKDFTQEKSTGWPSNKTEFGYTTPFVSDGLLVHTTKRTTNNWDGSVHSYG